MATKKSNMFVTWFFTIQLNFNIGRSLVPRFSLPLPYIEGELSACVCMLLSVLLLQLLSLNAACLTVYGIRIRSSRVVGGKTKASFASEIPLNPFFPMFEGTNEGKVYRRSEQEQS